MNPKMTVKDAALCLEKSESWLVSTLQKRQLDFLKSQNQYYFGFETARQLFQLPFTPKVFVFQIVKGGTGKTSLVHEFAVRASLYGARVLCVDMDQQGNLTQAFNINAESLPVMVDVLVDNHPLVESIVPIAPGIDLLPSRFENAMLDEAIRLKNCPLEAIYREPLQALKKQYDVIVVDCPPSLGQSVAACALAADTVLAPVTPEKFALSGLEMAYQSLEELQTSFGLSIDFGVVLNKFEARNVLSQNAAKYLLRHPKYQNKLFKNYIRLSRDFPNTIAKNGSIYDTVKQTAAKEDVDFLTQELLGIFSYSSVSIDALSMPFTTRKKNKANNASRSNPSKKRVTLQES
jgi:chromosome partitioning protein